MKGLSKSITSLTRPDELIALRNNLKALMPELKLETPTWVRFGVPSTTGRVLV
jgi:hypothetical protein